MHITSLKATVQDRIDQWADELRTLSRELHADPELAYEEHRSATRAAGLLERAGFKVEKGVAGLPTAFTAVVGPDDADVTVGLCLEYDALPELGHACGHNVIAASGAGAAIGLAAVADALGIRVKAIGTPAEEGGGGKVHLLRGGAFDDVSVAMMAHPSQSDEIGSSSRASRHFEITYQGKAAHAAAAPQLGVNAADATVVAQTALGLLRQQLPDGIRVHGIVTEGGARNNIIPARTHMSWQLRADTLEELDALWPRVRACFDAGAVATGCELEITEPAPAYAELRQDEWLTDAYAANITARGRTPRRTASVGASTDMGNITHVMPAIHPSIGLGCDSAPHTPGFAAAAASPEAEKALVDVAIALAWTAVHLCVDPDQRAHVRDAHRLRVVGAARA
ncbi:amidohydrolase [Streptomyces sp. NPDC051453]|uniref:amidohydrolase n=1 Tax=Streptomyces sp. NPDC051453 TaxID=3154941 RepID=UPI00342CB944